MMAMSEERSVGRMALKVVGTAVLILVFAYSLGVVVGASEALLEGRGGPARIARLAVALVSVAGCVWGVIYLRPWPRRDEPVAPRTRKANNLLLLSGVLGGVIGVALAVATISMDEPLAMFSNGPIAPAIVVPVLAVWLLIVPLISWQWHRSVDEHEAEAYRFGGLAGLYLYAFLAPAWWLAARGGLVPAPDTMVIYAIVLGVWGIGWFWRRYR